MWLCKNNSQSTPKNTKVSEAAKLEKFFIKRGYQTIITSHAPEPKMPVLEGGMELTLSFSKCKPLKSTICPKYFHYRFTIETVAVNPLEPLLELTLSNYYVASNHTKIKRFVFMMPRKEHYGWPLVKQQNPSREIHANFLHLKFG